MQRYISIMEEDDLDKRVKRYKKMIIKMFKGSFGKSVIGNTVGDTVISFLMCCAAYEKKSGSKKYKEDLFYPSLKYIDTMDVWEKFRRNLMCSLPSIDDYLSNSNTMIEYDDSSKPLDLRNYMNDYCSYIIEARLFNDANTPFLKITDEEIIFFCKMIIGEFVGQIDLMDLGKSDLSTSTLKRLKEILKDNENLESKLAILESINTSLRNEVNIYKNKKEKVIYKEDKERISILNKKLKEADTRISELEEEILNISRIENIASIQEREGNTEKEIDFNSRVIFIGGCLNTVQNLKRIFTNASFYDKENDVDKTTIIRCDYVVYLTNFMSHALYYKVRNMRSNKKQVHCASDNVIRVLDEICKNI